MNAAADPAVQQHGALADADELARRLRAQTQGEVMVDAASRGRYATDASIYQIMPTGVFVPRNHRGCRHCDRDQPARWESRCCRAAAAPRSAGRPPARRWSSTTANTCAAIVAVDANAMTAEVEPGLVLDHLNAELKPLGLWYPVDVSTSAQATLGGMAGNNSCGSRSIAYGNMVHNVLGIDGWLADGSQVAFGPVEPARRARARASPISSARWPIGTAPRSMPAGRRCCAGSAATTSTSSIRKASGRIPTMAASTWRTCWSAAKARWRSPSGCASN